MRTAKTLVLAALFTAPALADVVDFENLDHGEVVTNQYAGLWISALGDNAEPGAAVVFNTRDSDSDDTDLKLSDLTVGNLAQTDAHLSNLLIFQSLNSGYDSDHDSDHDSSDNDDHDSENKHDDHDHSDDHDSQNEIEHAAGQIILDFSNHIFSFGFDVFGEIEPGSEGSSIAFYSGNTLISQIDFMEFETNGMTPGVQFGDHSANRIDPVSLNAGFDRVVFSLGEEVALDNFNFTAVPAPSSVFVIAGVTLLAPRRRRR